MGKLTDAMGDRGVLFYPTHQVAGPAIDDQRMPPPATADRRRDPRAAQVLQTAGGISAPPIQTFTPWDGFHARACAPRTIKTVPPT
ncbi:MAG: hypothetical protein IPJ65_38920 [Archangiaceae bacterium]|nr:hypothetical protein [Archangiaceae bacterium]